MVVQPPFDLSEIFHETSSLIHNPTLDLVNFLQRRHGQQYHVTAPSSHSASYQGASASELKKERANALASKISDYLRDEEKSLEASHENLVLLEDYRKSSDEGTISI